MLTLLRYLTIRARVSATHCEQQRCRTPLAWVDTVGRLVKAAQFEVHPWPSDTRFDRTTGSSVPRNVAQTVHMLPPVSLVTPTGRDSNENLLALSAAGGAIQLAFSRRSGYLTRLEAGGQPLLSAYGGATGALGTAGPRHTLWRAPIDNDEGGLSVGMPAWLAKLVKQYPNPLWSYAERWRYAQLDRLVEHLISFEDLGTMTHNGA
jgi:hypothetical protein